MGIIKKELRPWGWYKGIGFSRFWVKLIRVNPGECTSRQYHTERSELHLAFWPPPPWGECRVVRRYEVHRLLGGWYIELAWGHPREDDIVRLEDKYGRNECFN